MYLLKQVAISLLNLPNPAKVPVFISCQNLYVAFLSIFGLQTTQQL